MHNHYFPRLKILRELNSQSQKEIAKVIDTTQQYYGRYENGETPIPIDRLILLAKYYKVSLDYIVELSEMKNDKDINNDEKQLINKYKKLSDKNKGKLEFLAEQLVRQEQKEKPKP